MQGGLAEERDKGRRLARSRALAMLVARFAIPSGCQNLARFFPAHAGVTFQKSSAAQLLDFNCNRLNPADRSYTVAGT